MSPRLSLLGSAKDMKLKLTRTTAALPRRAFTLIEVMVASALGGIMFLAALAGFSSGFQGIQLDRENSRAAQILLEKTELVRLYNWNQITGGDTNIYIPTNFTAPFYPDGSSGGVTFTGTVGITTVSLPVTYSNDMRAITISLTWKSRTMVRTRSTTTYISRFGLQNYIY